MEEVNYKKLKGRRCIQGNKSKSPYDSLRYIGRSDRIHQGKGLYISRFYKPNDWDIQSHCYILGDNWAAGLQNFAGKNTRLDRRLPYIENLVRRVSECKGFLVFLVVGVLK